MDKLNEFDDMVLGAAYLIDKTYQKYKKRKKLRLRKRVMRKENIQPLDVYLEHIQEGFFSDLNCKRIRSAIKTNLRDIAEIKASTHCSKYTGEKAKKCAKVFKEGIQGITYVLKKQQTTFKNKCSHMR